MARNVADLNDSEDVRRLRARLGGADPFAGTTLAAAQRVAKALDGLWSDYLLLSRIVEEATALLRRPLFGPARADEAAALLDSASIRLPAVSVPVRARGLLDAAERSETATPTEVLDAMVAGFDAARRGAAAIATAETATRVKIAALRAGSAAGDTANAARLDDATRVLGRDPLAAADRIAPLAAALAAARAEAEAAGRRRSDFAAALARARADLAALEVAGARREAARAAAVAVVVLPATGIAAMPGPDGLAAWLDRLATAGPEDAASARGLDRWSAACAEARSAAAASEAAVGGALRERDDLRGRFRALRAKAEALAGRGGPSRDEAAGVAAELDRAPFDVARARAHLARFEAALAAVASRPGVAAP